jgi:SAM-dependent methyltransferase
MNASQLKQSLLRLAGDLSRLLGKCATFDGGKLEVPNVRLGASGTHHRATLRLLPSVPMPTFELESIDPPMPAAGVVGANGEARILEGTLTFVCNVCGATNTNVSMNLVGDREGNSCSQCGSSLRIRSVIEALTTELFGKSMSLTELPVSKQFHGIGMSDWDGYALPLAEKLSYTNTYYHQAPRLDILDVPESEHGKYDFIISSDVMEHVPGDVNHAFANMAKLLKPGGVLILTVPYKADGEDEEFFPDLHDFHLVTTAGKTFLYNKTATGEEQIYDNLVFHGGSGFTLFMRLFSEAGLLKRLRDSGFNGGIKVYRDNDPAHGVVWPISWCLALAARKAA